MYTLLLFFSLLWLFESHSFNQLMTVNILMDEFLLGEIIKQINLGQTYKTS